MARRSRCLAAFLLLLELLLGDLLLLLRSLGLLLQLHGRTQRAGRQKHTLSHVLHSSQGLVLLIGGCCHQMLLILIRGLGGACLVRCRRRRRRCGGRLV